ncbi:MAG: STAS domain-containing protein [Candidatus Dormibacteraceae bacterium]
MDGDEVYADKQLVISRTGSPSQLTVSGAIDFYNAKAATAALTRELKAFVPAAEGLPDAVSGNGDLRIDVSGLEFTDVTGIRALVKIAEDATPGHRIVLRGLPSRIRTVIAAVGWSDLPNLVIEGE